MPSLSPAPNRVYYPQIDGLRFLGFLLVFFTHFSIYVPSTFLYKMGWVGVHLFFFISGFLLTKLLQIEYKVHSTISIKKYFYRRVLRIWPLYFTYLLLILLFLIVFNKEFSIVRFMGNVFFIDNVLVFFYGLNTNIGALHLWTISVEEQFYLMLPFFLLFIFKIPRKQNLIAVLLVLFVFGIFIFPFLNGRTHFPHFSIRSSWVFLIAGLLLGLGYGRNLMQKINPYAALLLSVVFMYVAGLYFAERGPILINCLIVGSIILSFLLLFSTVFYDAKNWVYKLFTLSPIRYLGKISYGLYIFHTVVIGVTKSIFKEVPQQYLFLSLFFALFFNIVIAVISYEFFERKFLLMKENAAIIKNQKP